ncbi:MAG: hypothetical protein KGL62_02050 [Bradyrhizobium sp.]|uniref:hypothetical protein n=1 Tax=Bradyrhizobium sp. TaxID=376 RepID=UPI0023820B4B|nr:hypothetical protein [Bradyrhizobium sp.]MDE2601130.1 hypothetical protein [Bradyrhizobium sp.]
MSSISIAEPGEAPEGIDGGYPCWEGRADGRQYGTVEPGKKPVAPASWQEIQGEIGPGIGPISRAHFIRLCCRRRPAGILGEHSCFEALVAIAVALSIGASLVQQRTGIRAGDHPLRGRRHHWWSRVLEPSSEAMFWSQFVPVHNLASMGGDVNENNFEVRHLRRSNVAEIAATIYLADKSCFQSGR